MHDYSVGLNDIESGLLDKLLGGDLYRKASCFPLQIKKYAPKQKPAQSIKTD